MLKPFLQINTKLLFWIGPAIAAVCLIVLGGLVGVGQFKTVNEIVDVSWPNCKFLPTEHYQKAVIGVTGGLDFAPNTCLGIEPQIANNYELYVNTGDPGFPRIRQLGTGPLSCHKYQLVCYSYNYGFMAAKYAIRQAELAGTHSPMWWLDVESINSWTNSVAANRADIAGMVDAIHSLPLMTPRIGIYTAANQWVAIVGHWQIGLPLWLGTGDTAQQQAKQACKLSSVTGGQLVLTQYTVGALDYNYPCNISSNQGYF